MVAPYAPSSNFPFALERNKEGEHSCILWQKVARLPVESWKKVANNLLFSWKKVVGNMLKRKIIRKLEDWKESTTNKAFSLKVRDKWERPRSYDNRATSFSTWNLTIWGGIIDETTKIWPNTYVFQADLWRFLAKLLLINVLISIFAAQFRWVAF